MDCMVLSTVDGLYGLSTVDGLYGFVNCCWTVWFCQLLMDCMVLSTVDGLYAFVNC